MVVLLTCKNTEDPIKNEGARVFTTLYIDFSDAQGQITLESVVVSSPNWNSSKVPCMSLLPTRMKMIHTKMKELEWSQHFPIISIWEFFKTLKGSILHSPWSDLVQFPDMAVLVTCKNKEDQIKNESARVVTRFSSL